MYGGVRAQGDEGSDGVETPSNKDDGRKDGREAGRKEGRKEGARTEGL